MVTRNGLTSSLPRVVPDRVEEAVEDLAGEISDSLLHRPVVSGTSGVRAVTVRCGCCYRTANSSEGTPGAGGTNGPWPKVDEDRLRKMSDAYETRRTRSWNA